MEAHVIKWQIDNQITSIVIGINSVITGIELWIHKLNTVAIVAIIRGITIITRAQLTNQKICQFIVK